MKKTCSKCGVEKAVSEFHKCKTGKYGVRGNCKECNVKRALRHNKNNPDKIAKNRKRYYEKNKKDVLERNKKWKEKNPEKVIDCNKKWREKNLGYRAKYLRERYANDPEFKLSCLIRDFTRRVTTAVKQQKELRSLEYLGCSLDEFKSHIESLWLEDMSWDNHGDWHIDHKIPLDWFVKNSDDPWKANHYSDLQPLWAEANLSKGNTL